MEGEERKICKVLMGEKKAMIALFLCYCISRYVAVTETVPKKHHFLYLLHSFQEL